MFYSDEESEAGGGESANREGEVETVCDLVMLFGIICIAALLARVERTIGTIRERHNNSLELLLSFLFLNTSVRKMGISEIFSTLKHNKSSPPCVQFSKVLCL